MDRKEEILHAAEKTFLKYGLQKCTMEDIAKVCGIKKTALYYYFKNREEIFFLMIKNKLESLRREIYQAVEKEKSTRTKIKAFMIQKAKKIKENLPFFNLLYKKNFSLCHLESERNRYISYDFNALINIIREGINKGDIFVKHPESLTLMIQGVTYGSFFAINIMKADWNYDKIVDDALNIIFQGIGKK